VDTSLTKSKEKASKRYHLFHTKRSQELRGAAIAAANLQVKPALRACILCCEIMHEKEYNKGVQVRPESGGIIYAQTKQWEDLAMKYNMAPGGTDAGLQTRAARAGWGICQQMGDSNWDRELWGFEIKARVRTYVQLRLIGCGVE